MLNNTPSLLFLHYNRGLPVSSFDALFNVEEAVVAALAIEFILVVLLLPLFLLLSSSFFTGTKGISESVVIDCDSVDRCGNCCCGGDDDDDDDDASRPLLLLMVELLGGISGSCNDRVS